MSWGHLVGLAFHRPLFHILNNESSFHVKRGGHINKLLDPPFPFTMASRRAHLSGPRRRRTSLQGDKGTLPFLVYRAAVRPDNLQESGLEVSRNKNYKSGEANSLKTFHGFKRAVRPESLKRNTRLSQQKKHAPTPSGILPKAN